MSMPLRRDIPLTDFSGQNPVVSTPPVVAGSSLAECLERISVLSSQALENEAESQPTSPLKRLVREVQELMQMLLVHESFSIVQPFVEHQEKIQYMAFYDSLTGLPNRQFFEMYVRQLMESSNSESLFYVIFLDLDGFKEINDTYGHEVGDTLLKHVSKRLRHSLRQNDVVARFGGDEFTVLLNFEDNENLDFILRRLIDSIAEPYHVDSLTLQINVSLGIAKYPVSGESCEELIKKADMAMYMSKSKGNNLYTLNF